MMIPSRKEISIPRCPACRLSIVDEFKHDIMFDSSVHCRHTGHSMCVARTALLRIAEYAKSSAASADVVVLAEEALTKLGYTNGPHQNTRR